MADSRYYVMISQKIAETAVSVHFRRVHPLKHMAAARFIKLRVLVLIRTAAVVFLCICTFVRVNVRPFKTHAVNAGRNTGINDRLYFPRSLNQRILRHIVAQIRIDCRCAVLQVIFSHCLRVFGKPLVAAAVGMHMDIHKSGTDPIPARILHFCAGRKIDVLSYGRYFFSVDQNRTILNNTGRQYGFCIDYRFHSVTLQKNDFRPLS